MSELKRIAVYSPNGDDVLRERMKFYAQDKHPGAVVLPRVNRFVTEGDLEQVIAVVVLPVNVGDIGRLYGSKGVEVIVYEQPEIKLPPPPPEPPSIVSEPAPIPVVTTEETATEPAPAQPSPTRTVPIRRRTLTK